MEQKSKTYIRPIVIVMIFVFLTIGYAYLTSALNINGSTLLKKPTWDVHFENVQVKDGSVTGEQVTQEPTIGDNETSVTFHVNLKLPGDYYELTVDAVNAGTIDAMIDTYTNLELTEEQQAYLETSVTYSDGEEIQQHQQLLVGDIAVYKIRVGYKLDLTAEDLPSAPSQLSFTFSTNFIQRDASVAIMRRAEHTLYNVLKNTAESGGLAKKYTGAHQDSMDVSRSTKDVYLWKIRDRYDGLAVSRKNNVLFGNTCWRMIRTTDTGGVKLLYNGEPVDGACPNERSYHKTFTYGSSATALNYNYYYGSDYEFDSSTSKYSLSGNVFQMVWNDSNYESIIGNYTCLSTSNGSCSDLYYIYDYKDSDSGYYFKTASLSYENIGKNSFNNEKSLSSTGYMKNDTYKNETIQYHYGKDYRLTDSILTGVYARTTFWYADSYEWDESTGKYRLVDPYKVSSSSEYSSLKGKYTMRDSTESTTIIYIVYVSSPYLYGYHMYDGKGINDYYITVGDSIVENNNSYTINNTQNVALYNFINNISDYKYKYTCGYGASSTCTSPQLIRNYRYETKYGYIAVNNYLLVAKSKNNYTLSDTLLLRIDDFFINYDSIYSEYRYTCGDTSTVCNKDTLKYITRINDDGFYNYYTYAKLGHNISWNGSQYTLNDVVEFDNYNNDEVISAHHFFCLDGSNSCPEVAFIYNKDEWYLNYITLKDGVTDLNDVINTALTSNEKDSTIKANIDRWFKDNMIDYNDYIEETIFCNNRAVADVGSYSINGNLSGSLVFDTSSVDNSLLCPNLSDRFSTLNSSAKLKYNVGLLTSSELKLLGNEIVDFIVSWNSFWLMDSGGNSSIITPTVSSTGMSGGSVFLINGYARTSVTDTNHATRPVISIKPGMEIESGNGSYENPYTLRLD